MADGMTTNDSPVLTADLVPSEPVPEQPIPVAAILVADRVNTVCEVAQIAKINPAQLAITPKRSWIAAFVRGLGSLIWYSPWRLFQFASLLVLLAVTSTIPVLQLASLGYMLEAGSRIARSGHWREGLPGLGMAGRIGSFFLGASLTFLPVWFIKDFATTAQLINPGSVDAKFLETFSWVLFFTWMGNLTWVFLRGAKWWHFYWPQPIRFVKEIWRPSTWQRANDNLWSAITRLRLPLLLWLGFRGGLGALCWLAIPATFMAIGLRAREEAPLLGLIGLMGAIGMTLVVMYIPFLQINLATQNRFMAIFDLKAVRNQYRCAPWSFLLALIGTLALAIPLYLLRIEATPEEYVWLPCVFFVLFTLPAKWLVGWAIYRSGKTGQKHSWWSRYPTYVVEWLAVPIYILFLYLSLLVVWDGITSVFLQHAFLIPLPFRGT
jgi:hypothetical protein